jgi:hypothetical protein
MALKVTGSMRDLPRKKVRVPSTFEQASLSGVTPFSDLVARTH